MVEKLMNQKIHFHSSSDRQTYSLGSLFQSWGGALSYSVSLWAQRTSVSDFNWHSILRISNDNTYYYVIKNFFLFSNSMDLGAGRALVVAYTRSMDTYYPFVVGTDTTSDGIYSDLGLVFLYFRF